MVLACESPASAAVRDANLLTKGAEMQNTTRCLHIPVVPEEDHFFRLSVFGLYIASASVDAVLPTPCLKAPRRL